MNTKRLLLLLSKFQDNTCSEQELQELEQWYENLNIGNQHISDYQNKKFSTEMIDEFKSRLRNSPIVVPFYRKTIFKVAAVSIIAVLTTAVIMVYSYHANKIALAKNISNEKQDITPPKISKATITLANGQTILLDSLGNDKLVKQEDVNLVRSDDSQIIYTGTSSNLVYNTINNPRGSKVISLTLNDGTKVWINSESSLRFPIAFVGNQRHVEIKGEAYFEVAKDNNRKFIVTSNEVSTEVLGTHFNVNTYENEQVVKITLLEGAIKVRKGHIANILSPGQQAEVNSDIKVKRDVDIDAVMSWKNGFFNFSNTSVAEIMKQISRWYDVEIVYINEIPKRHFGGEISREASLKEVLIILNKSKVKCKLEEGKLIIE